MAQFAGNNHWAETSPPFLPMLGWRAPPSPVSCENDYLYMLFALAEETAAQLVVGFIVWPFPRRKKPSSSEMSTRSYAVHSACPKYVLFYLPFHSILLLFANFLIIRRSSAVLNVFFRVRNCGHFVFSSQNLFRL